MFESLEVRREPLGPDAQAELRAAFGLERLLLPAAATLRLRGVPTAAANSLRRAIIDEIEGRCLVATGFDSTDPHVLPELVLNRVALIPLSQSVTAEQAATLAFRLDVANETGGVLYVYAGDLRLARGAMPEPPIFNPTFRLAALQPGTRLVLGEVRIESGFGRNHARFAVARRAALRPLDLTERPERETHDVDGGAIQLSSYVESCLVANPRRHELRFWLEATASAAAARGEAAAVLRRGAAAVRDRLRLAAAAVAARPAPTAGGARYEALDLGELGEGRLEMPGETATIGNLLSRYVSEVEPGVSHVGHELLAEQDLLRLTLRSTDDVTEILLRAIRAATAVFEELMLALAER